MPILIQDREMSTHETSKTHICVYNVVFSASIIALHIRKINTNQTIDKNWYNNIHVVS